MTTTDDFVNGQSCDRFPEPPPDPLVQPLTEYEDGSADASAERDASYHREWFRWLAAERTLMRKCLADFPDVTISVERSIHVRETYDHTISEFTDFTLIISGLGVNWKAVNKPTLPELRKEFFDFAAKMKAKAEFEKAWEERQNR